MRYLEIYNLSSNQPLETAVRGVCMKQAEVIRDDPSNTQKHQERLDWANQPVAQNARQMMAVIALSTTIQDKWVARAAEVTPMDEPDRFDDTDIETIVTDNINRFAV